MTQQPPPVQQKAPPLPTMPELAASQVPPLVSVASVSGSPLELVGGTPTAEPGTTTSEWKLGIGALVANGIALGVAFGVHIDAQQQQAIIAFVASTTSMAGLYALARGIRKRGTAG